MLSAEWEITDADFFHVIVEIFSAAFRGECATGMRKTPGFRVRINMTHHAEFYLRAIS